MSCEKDYLKIISQAQFADIYKNQLIKEKYACYTGLCASRNIDIYCGGDTLIASLKNQVEILKKTIKR